MQIHARNKDKDLPECIKVFAHLHARYKLYFQLAPSFYSYSSFVYSVTEHGMVGEVPLVAVT